MDYVALIVGALLAIAGGLIGQFVAFRLKLEESRRDLRLRRLDQLIAAMLEDEGWLNDYRRSLLFGDGEHDRNSPFNQIQAIVSVYFDEELSETLSPLRLARHTFSHAIGLGFQNRLQLAMANNTELRVTAADQALITAVETAYDPYYEAFLVFREKCAEVAKANL